MTIDSSLVQRANSKCELCNASSDLKSYSISPTSDDSLEKSVLICSYCKDQIESLSDMESNHWRCLSESMWSEHKPVQVLVWSVLKRLSSGVAAPAWALDLKSQMYMDEEAMNWARELSSEPEEDVIISKDSNGAKLESGDSVTLIKDLVVKGANFTAKRGTMVRNISLTDDPKHIEGRVNGTRIVLVCAFLKKV